MHFLDKYIVHIGSKPNAICYLGSNWQYNSTCLGDDLAPINRQAITWTNVDQYFWGHIALLNHNEFKIIT